MWKPGRLTTQWVFMTYYRDSFTLPFYLYCKIIQWTLNQTTTRPSLMTKKHKCPCNSSLLGDPQVGEESKLYPILND
jgi:hypothetical protein